MEGSGSAMSGLGVFAEVSVGASAAVTTLCCWFGRDPLALKSIFGFGGAAEVPVIRFGSFRSKVIRKSGGEMG